MIRSLLFWLLSGAATIATAQVTGQVEVVRACDFRNGRSQTFTRIHSESGSFELTGPGVEGLTSGSYLRVHGAREGGRLAVRSFETVRTFDAGACTTTGAQKVVVLLVKFPGSTTPSLTTAQVASTFFGSGVKSLDAFWREGSYGKTSASGDVYGWFTLDQAYTCDQYDAMRTAALKAADATVNFANYTRIFIIFPDPNQACAWAGLGNIGCITQSTTGDGAFMASTVWIPADIMQSSTEGPRVVAHEAGHNLGLDHSFSRDFGAQTLGAVGTQGTLTEYNDYFSSMGLASGHYNAHHKKLLGWLTDADIATVETAGTYNILPLESTATGTKALKVRRTTGVDAWLWLEYRTNTGLFDSTIPTAGFNSTIVYYQDSFSTDAAGTTHLIDFTPGSSTDNTTDFQDAPLAAGRKWSDLYTTRSLEVTAASSSALTVKVAQDASSTITTTISTSPAGMLFFVDGKSYVAPHNFTWAIGSTHTLSVPSPQEKLSARYAFSSWSDIGATNARSITVSGATPTAIAATFAATNQVVAYASPAAGGTVTVNGAAVPAAGAYYGGSTTLVFAATANTGYRFMGFSGDLSGSTTPQTLSATTPRSVVAHFAPTASTNVAPFATDLAPYVGAGASQAFSATFVDLNGGTDIARAQLRIFESTEFKAGTCAVELRMPARQMYLRDDANSAWLGPVSPGTTSTIENAACRLKGTGSSVSVSGNYLYFTAAFDFKTAFGSAGGREPRKIVCLDSFDAAGAGDKVQCIGQWVPESSTAQQLARYRGYIPQNQEHFFTPSLGERNALITILGLQPERPRPGDVFNQPTTVSGVSTQPYFRVQDLTPTTLPAPYTNYLTHFWTRDRFEFMNAARPGAPMFVEGPESHILSAVIAGACPYYRLRFGGSRRWEIYHYALRDEHDILVQNYGWNSMGLEGYLQATSCRSCDADGNVIDISGCNDEATGLPRLVQVASAARERPGPVAAGELTRIYGAHRSRFARVLVNGEAVPVVGVDDRYVEFVMPQVDGVAAVSVDDFGERSAPAAVAVVAVNPSILVDGMQGAGLARTLDAAHGEVTILVSGIEAADPVVRIGGHVAAIIAKTPHFGLPGVTALTVQVPESLREQAGGTVELTVNAADIPSQPGVLIRLP